jgi:hypothetical protein
MALKLGAEDKKKVYIAGGLGVIVLFLVVRMFLDDGSSPAVSAPASAPVVAQAPAPSASARASASEGRDAVKLNSSANALDPTLHPEIMAQAESLEYTGTGRNIFSLTSVPVDIPKPIVSPRQQAIAQQTGPPPPPPPPVIDLKFFGYSSRQSGLRRAFLLKGDDVFIASEGEVVDHRYKVVKIAPTSVQVEDIPYANTQSLPLVQN